MQVVKLIDSWAVVDGNNRLIQAWPTEQEAQAFMAGAGWARARVAESLENVGDQIVAAVQW